MLRHQGGHEEDGTTGNNRYIKARNLLQKLRHAEESECSSVTTCEDHTSHHWLVNFLEDPEFSKLSHVWNLVVVYCIVISVVVAVLQTSHFNAQHGLFYEICFYFEFNFTVVFTLELILRACAAYKDENKYYFFCWGTFFDILATFPGFLDIYIHHEVHKQVNDEMDEFAPTLRLTRITRMTKFLRILRTLRIARLIRGNESLMTVYESLQSLRHSTFIFVIAVSVASVVCGLLIFLIEGDDPDTQINSLPIALWWACTTLTTVGYGDIVPQTALGHMAGICVMWFGVLLTSICVGLVSVAFTEDYLQRIEDKEFLEEFSEFSLDSHEVRELKIEWKELEEKLKHFCRQLRGLILDFEDIEEFQESPYWYLCDEMNDGVDKLGKKVKYLLKHYRNNAEQKNGEAGSRKSAKKDSNKNSKVKLKISPASSKELNDTNSDGSDSQALKLEIKNSRVSKDTKGTKSTTLPTSTYDAGSERLTDHDPAIMWRRTVEKQSVYGSVPVSYGVSPLPQNDGSKDLSMRSSNQLQIKPLGQAIRQSSLHEDDLKDSGAHSKTMEQSTLSQSVSLFTDWNQQKTASEQSMTNQLDGLAGHLVNNVIEVQCTPDRIILPSSEYDLENNSVKSYSSRATES